MAQNVIINGVTYASVPEVNIPKSGGGTARYMDTSDATATAEQMLNGATSYVNGSKVTGNIPTKAAATYTPTTSDQTIAAAQYLGGAQIVKGDVNLIAANIKAGVSIFNIDGTLALPSISQDGTTKILTIS